MAKAILLKLEFSVLLAGQIALLFALAGCSEAERLESNYAKTVEKHGSVSERCASQREIAAAYSKEGNEWQYRIWQNRSTITCMRESLDRPFS